MPEPIVITVTATPDPQASDKLIVTADLPTIYLSLDDEDQVRWVCQGGTIEVVFAPTNNPFDANPNTGGQYQASADGSIVSGILDEARLDPNAEVFRSFKYSILVRSTDGARMGVLDPRVSGRRRRVYHRGTDR